jgi:hypothetical protein
MVAVFIAGVVVGRIGCKVRIDEERDELARENAMLHACLLITRCSLQESLNRHRKVLEENGHG